MGAETLNWRGILCILGVLSEVFSSLVRVMPRILGVLSEVFSSLVRVMPRILGVLSEVFSSLVRKIDLFIVR